MRGEHSLPRGDPRRCGGSSPHARGTPSNPNQVPEAERFIPACAGNTPPRCWSSQSRTVHPRMRGEHQRKDTAGLIWTGSSPHARGTREIFQSHFAQIRFIPACAGNTSPLISYAAAITVHPRMRGEHRTSRRSLCRWSGSSPHARGTPLGDTDGVPRSRFIPACAGNTLGSSHGPPVVPVHPRMRGEHSASTDAVKVENGSSPHARGTRCARSGRADSSRFIPACAGNTIERVDAVAADPVHPRMRGEHGLGIIGYKSANGSSPHALGTPPSDPAASGRNRFIPACAGNTSASSVARSKSTVHPRMRGEHLVLGWW